ncbi:MAG: YidC/Oxa1 family membrane protein insertase [Clostridia bacterium]|nr:YidC/Oxa1 family membrane protein insertase [Clostridia bacterium]
MNFISAFLKQILDAIYGWVGNYGVAVILFTLLIRIVLLPLDIKSKKSMRRMSKIQPKVTALQQKYSKEPDKMNQKVQELYRKEQVSPLSGCLPMLISLPILFCMYSAMRAVSNEHTVQMLMDMMNGNTNPVFEGFLWIKNVFQPDSFMHSVVPYVGDELKMISAVGGSSILTEANLEAVRAFLATDAYGEIAKSLGAFTVLQAPMVFFTINIPQIVNGFFILPLLAGGSQLLSTKLLNNTQGQAADSTAQQTTQMMTWMFPLFSIWICATTSAGFSIYWVFVNIVQIVEQYFLNLYFEKKDAGKPEEVIDL